MILSTRRDIAARGLKPENTLPGFETALDLDVAATAEQGASILSPRSTIVTPSLLAEAHDLGLQVIPWTVNDAEEMQRLIEMGVDGLITDRPDRLLALFDR